LAAVFESLAAVLKSLALGRPEGAPYPPSSRRKSKKIIPDLAVDVTER